MSKKDYLTEDDKRYVRMHAGSDPAVIADRIRKNESVIRNYMESWTNEEPEEFIPVSEPVPEKPVEIKQDIQKPSETVKEKPKAAKIPTVSEFIQKTSKPAKKEEPVSAAKIPKMSPQPVSPRRKKQSEPDPADEITPDMQKTSKELCQTCRFGGKSVAMKGCNYYLDTGVRRGCPVGWCNKYEKAKGRRPSGAGTRYLFPERKNPQSRKQSEPDTMEREDLYE